MPLKTRLFFFGVRRTDTGTFGSRYFQGYLGNFSIIPFQQSAISCKKHWKPHWLRKMPRSLTGHHDLSVFWGPWLSWAFGFTHPFKSLKGLVHFWCFFLNRAEVKHKWLSSPYCKDVFLELNCPLITGHSIPNINKSSCDLTFSKTNTVFLPLCSFHFPYLQLFKNTCQWAHQTRCDSWNTFIRATHSLDC